MFESLKEIEGLNDDTIKAIEEKLQPEIEKNFNANYGKTLGEIDEFIQDFTGVQKKDNQFTSKYIKEAL
ncbi:MAG: hypothetical protein GWN01_00130, partial [Nitrosopumilaceae archaeon]|nr:hypothetical protein [Nitrosopumilaceae archaeon]NIU85754.1 hypothetical protein [Nitrosopumilaceae archaeon]NIX59997.1 hypothetical protein [Nitrosopumilaceae archaeon]